MDDEIRRYDRTENELTWIGALLAIILLAGLPLLSGNTDHPLLLATALLPAVALLLTHSLRVRVNAGALHVQMGNGWIRRRIALDEIRGLRRDRGPRGWGPRYHRGRQRTLMGFAGREALQLQLEHECVCIVTEAAAELESFLSSLLRERAP